MPNPNDKNYPSGRTPVIFMGDINYGDTTYRDLFQLPAGCVIVDGRINGSLAASSNGAPLLSVGISPSSGGTGTEYLNGWSIAAAQGSNFQGSVPFTHLGAQSSNYGTYSSWGVGSNSFWVSGKVSGTTAQAGSGPWTVIFEVIDV